MALFGLVKDYAGSDVSCTEMVGRDSLPRRMRRKSTLAGPAVGEVGTQMVTSRAGRPPAAPIGAGGAPPVPLRRPGGSAPGQATLLATDIVAQELVDKEPWDGVVKRIASLPGHVWVAAESLDFYPVGTEFELDATRDVMLGERTAMHNVSGDWLKCKLMTNEEAYAHRGAVRQRCELPPGPPGATTPRLGLAAGTTETEETVRTWSGEVFQEHFMGDRCRAWRIAVRKSRGLSWPRLPLDLGPGACLELMRGIGRNNGGLLTWFSAWVK